jgi:tetratricopeptide (TPR) repeat protein
MMSSAHRGASSSSSGPVAIHTPLTALPTLSELDVSLTHARLRNYELRALACQRAGRRSAEANALFCMGVLYDNIAEHAKAIECYRRFKDILCAPREAALRAAAAYDDQQQHPNAGYLRTAEEQFAEALAHNAMGISSQLLDTDAGYRAALFHHARHRDLADLPGSFVAHTNLGLVYQLMASVCETERNSSSGGTASHNEDGYEQQGHGLDSLTDKQRALTEQAAFAHQAALRAALAMSSLAAQNIAIGNLGLTGLQHRDLVTARACMERHLQLSQSLHDYAGQSSALQALGLIASQEGAHEQARLHFQSAWQVAHVLQDPVTADAAKVAVGVAIANAQIEQRMREAARAAME